MTVEELIELLKREDSDAVVRVDVKNKKYSVLDTSSGYLLRAGEEPIGIVVIVCE
jgi:hypothetical protein